MKIPVNVKIIKTQMNIKGSMTSEVTNAKVTFRFNIKLFLFEFYVYFLMLSNMNANIIKIQIVSKMKYALKDYIRTLF